VILKVIVVCVRSVELSSAVEAPDAEVGAPESPPGVLVGFVSL
jgi:hypothetical protein